MLEYCRQIAAVMARDPGGRGLPGNVPPPDLEGLAESLLSLKSALIVTGFPIVPAKIGETDGPGGAANIARLLTGLGADVAVVTDDYSLPLVQAACALHAPMARAVRVPMEGAEAFCDDLLARIRPTHVIAIERPGKHGGHYHNMRGHVLDAYVADTDRLFSAFDGCTVAIGDGGNELGMGSFADVIRANVPGGGAICADLGAAFPLAAGISNWWGWGLQALISVATGRNLMPTRAEEWELLQAVLRAGGVDGVSFEPKPTVDGMPFDEYTAPLDELRTIVCAALGQKEDKHA